MLTCNPLCAAGVERRDRTEQKRKEKKRDRTEKKRKGKKRKEKKRFPLSSFHQNNCRSDTRHLKMNILFGYYTSSDYLVSVPIQHLLIIIMFLL